VKKLAIAIVLWASLTCSPVHAKTFVGVLWPLFGPVAAIGLADLVAELRMIPEVEVSTYMHQSWPNLVEDINRQPPGTHIAVIGYSLGANNSILVANNATYVDLIIALQPSMLSSDDPPLSAGKVGRMIEIYNPNPWMTFGGMGSRKLVGENIEYIANNDTHPGAQFNLEFRNLAKTEAAKLAAKDRQDAARTEMRKSVRLAQAGRSAILASEGQAIQRQRHSASNARVKVAQAETPNSPEPVKVDHPADEQRKQRQVSSTAFVDAVGSVSSWDLFFPRRLTIGDLKDYAKRTYHDLQKTDLIATVSDQPGTTK
jgi:hypothetical protein